jgi:toxin ParE1/3/4
MAELIWSEETMLDVEKIYDYIDRDSRQYTHHQIEHIISAVERVVFLSQGVIFLSFLIYCIA